MTVNRVTQISTETSSENTPANRLSKIDAEVVASKTASNRLSKIDAEVVASKTANNRVSQISAEVIISLSEPAISQVALEVLEDINPINSNTLKLCLPFDDTVGESFTIDESPSRHPIDLTTGGLPTIDATPSQFGDGALNLSGTDIARALLSQPDFNFTTDFTIEFWVYRNALTDGTVMGQWPAIADKGWKINFLGSNLEFEYTSDGSAVLTESAAVMIPAVTWTHLAFENFGGFFTTYVDGVAKLTSPSITPIHASVADLVFGENKSGISPAYEGSEVTEVATPDTQVFATKPAGVVEDEVMVMYHVTSNDITHSITAVGWTTIYTNIQITDGSTTSLYRKVATGSEPATYEVNSGTAEQHVVIITHYSGVNTGAPIAAFGNSTNAVPSTSAIAPSVAAASVPTLLITLGAGSSGGGTDNFTFPGGTIERVEGNITIDNQQSTEDESVNDYAVTFNGAGAFLDVDSNPDAGSIASLSLSGASNTYVSVPGSTDWDLGTGDFTVECYCNIDSNKFAALVGRHNANTNARWILASDASGNLEFWHSFFQRISTTTNMATEGWAHVAVSRNSGTTRMYLKGVQVGSTGTSMNISASTQTLHVGKDPEQSTRTIDGHMDAVRIIKGTGLYPSGTSFTPPSTPLSAVAGTVLLLNFDVINPPYGVKAAIGTEIILTSGATGTRTMTLATQDTTQAGSVLLAGTPTPDSWDGYIDELKVVVGEAVFQGPFIKPIASEDCASIVTPPDVSWTPGNLGEQDECTDSEFTIVITGLETVLGTQLLQATGLPDGMVIDNFGNIIGDLPIHTAPPTVQNYTFDVTLYNNGVPILGPDTFDFDVRDQYLNDILQVTIPALYEPDDRTLWKQHLYALIPNDNLYRATDPAFGISLTPDLFVIDGLTEDDLAAFVTALSREDGKGPEKHDVVIKTLSFGTTDNADVLFYTIEDSGSDVLSFPNPLGAKIIDPVLGITPDPIEPLSIDNTRDQLISTVGFDSQFGQEKIPDFLGGTYQPVLVAAFVSKGTGQSIIDKFDADGVHHVFKGRTITLDRINIKRCSTVWDENGGPSILVKFDDI